MRRVLAELRRGVSERSYRVLYLRWVEGWTTREIAAALGLTPAQVRSRDHRMIGKCRSLFDSCAGGGDAGMAGSRAVEKTKKTSERAQRLRELCGS
jgi:hypothetical protein